MFSTLRFLTNQHYSYCGVFQVLISDSLTNLFVRQEIGNFSGIHRTIYELIKARNDLGKILRGFRFLSG